MRNIIIGILKTSKKVITAVVIWPIAFITSAPKIIKVFRNPEMRKLIFPLSPGKEESEQEFDLRKRRMEDKMKDNYGLQHRYFSNTVISVFAQIFIHLNVLTSPLRKDYRQNLPTILLYSYLLHCGVVAFCIIQEKYESLKSSKLTPVNQSPLYDAYVDEVRFPIKKLLQGPNATNHYGSTELHMAIRRKDLKTVQSIMKNGSEALLEEDSLNSLLQLVPHNEDQLSTVRNELETILTRSLEEEAQFSPELLNLTPQYRKTKNATGPSSAASTPSTSLRQRLTQ